MINSTMKPGWSSVCLSECCEEISARVDNPSESGFNRFVGLEHMKSREVVVREWGRTVEVSSAMKLFQAGDVLVARRNVYLERAARINFDGVCSGDAIVLRPKQHPCLSELLPFILNTDRFWTYVSSQADGSMSKRISVERLMKYKVALPPIEEQRKIVSLLFSIQEEKECLRSLLIRSGQLESSVKQLYFSLKNDRVRLSKLMSEGKISYKTGPFGTVLKASSYISNGVPIVNPINMKDGKFAVDDGPFVGESDATRLIDYKILKYDLVFGRKGDIGRGVFAIPEYEGFILGSDCIRVRVLDESILPKYLFYFLSSPTSRLILGALAHGTTMPGINEKMLSRMEISIPPVLEQMEIVRKLDRIGQAKLEVQTKVAYTNSMLRTTINQLLGQ
jgi:type I restriction enzyme, S subunit